jgi:hypothetical protein
MAFSSILYGVLLLLLGYLLVRHVYTHPPRVFEPVRALVQHELLEPVLSLPAVQNLKALLPAKTYRPNRYGYGGLDPAGGERKGGDGRSIPDEVEVGWWNGRIEYPDRQLSPVQDSESIPEPQVAEVGWWGSDW